MKIWLSKNAEVSVGDQLVEQITLGIASRDLKTGERLPSTRELARRFQIHPNTVLAAYRKLAGSGLVEFRKGSGVYVSSDDNGDPGSLDRIFDRFMKEAEAAGHSREAIAEQFERRLDERRPARLLLVESDIQLQEILIAEIESATGCGVSAVTFEDLSNGSLDPDWKITAMFDEKEKLEGMLPDGTNCIFLRANSVSAGMSGRPRPGENDLIAVISAWERFIFLAKLFLLAAQIEADTLITRSPDSPGWQNGLQSASLIVCDFLTAKNFPDDPRVRVFPLIAASSLQELGSVLPRM